MMARARRILSVALVFAFGLVPAVVQAETKHPVPPRVLPSCTQVNQQVTLTLNTGTAGSPPPPGTADPIWTVVQQPSTPLTPFTTAAYSAPSLWLPNSANARWIQPAAGGAPINLPVATYVYSTQFTTPVDPYLYTSITITGNFAADDTALVQLNGITIATCTSTATIACFHSLQAIPVGVGLPMFNRISPFLNTLTVQVKNTSVGPSGLFVQAQVIAVCSKCTTPVPPPCGGNPSTC
jgi:hypothetical protein